MCIRDREYPKRFPPVTTLFSDTESGEEPEEPSDLELVLTLEEEVTEPKPEQPKPAEPVSRCV